MPDFPKLREEMVQRQIAARGIRDGRILEAFRTVPRHAFVDAQHAKDAYGDHPLPIAAGQTISQPYIVALMIEAAAVRPGDRVLEVGSGSGYAAAILSRIASQVVGIERHRELVESACARIQELGFDNVRIVHGDGSLGCLGGRPFDAILAAASGSHVPGALVDQLAPGGRLVMPLGKPGSVQKLVKLAKAVDGSIQQSELGEVRFVPLIGQEGWTHE